MKQEPLSRSAAAASPAPYAAPAGAATEDTERLSAWLDGELGASEADALAQRLLRDPDWRSRYIDWCAVGDALRSQEVIGGHSPRLCARIARALDSEPALLAPRALPGGARRHIATGFAVAAAAAVLVFVAVPQLRSGSAGAGAGTSADAGTSAGVAVADKVLAAGDPGAPVRNAAAGAHAFNPRLDPYIEAHREVTGTGVMPAAAVYLRFGGEGEQ